jgi:hypothetical protein
MVVLAVVFVSGGNYNFVKTTVCTFNPKFTTAAVDYSDTLLQGAAVVNTATGGIPEIDGPSASAALSAVTYALFFGQGASGQNILGQQLIALLGPNPQENATALLSTMVWWILCLILDAFY